MLVQKDFEELLRLFNKHKIRYCIVGAFAVAFYGYPRYTKDMDILVEPTLENGKKIIKALEDFGFKKSGLKEKDFSQEKRILQLGYEPVSIDIITSIKGCGFQEVWKKRKVSLYGKQKVNFIGQKNLIKAKLALGRAQDKIDLKKLIQVKKKG